VAPSPGDESRRPKKFYPQQALKDTIAIFVVFSILFLMAAVVRVPLEQLADPTDTSYIPRPEWYFLFLFQMLKLFKGPFEVIGSTVLPGLAVLALILVPFIDRGAIVKVTRRTFAVAVILFAAIGWGALTTAAVMTTPPGEAQLSIDYSLPTDWLQLSPEEMAGIGYFRAEKCNSCHPLAEGTVGAGPDLTRAGNHRTAAWMIQHFKSPAGVRPGSSMPPIQLSDSQLNTLAAFLLKLNPDNATALAGAPEVAVQGALVYQAQGCADCHIVNGSGMEVGPRLNGLANRRARSWVVEHFADPPKLSPGSIMPPYKLPTKDLDNLVAYLFLLPE
jgi:ubiquinol-cytochrome c reductase cytochrome b subunit